MSPYARAVTVEELGQELGVYAADLEVMIAALAWVGVSMMS